MEEEKVWEIDCRLGEEEISEAVLAGQPGKGRKRMAAALGILGVLMLVLYAVYPENITYSLLAVLAAAELYMVLAWPARQAQKAAKRFKGKRCRLIFTENGYLYTGEKEWLSSGNKITAAETEAVFAVRPDRQHLFILPKRCLSPEDCQEIRRALENRLKKSSMKRSGRYDR